MAASGISRAAPPRTRRTTSTCRCRGPWCRSGRTCGSIRASRSADSRSSTSSTAGRRLLDYIGQRKPPNPVVIGGDLHAFYVADLKPDFDDARSPVVATEFVGTSITTQPALTEAQAQGLLPDNPHLKLIQPARRGYVRVELTPTRMRIELQAMRSVT